MKIPNIPGLDNVRKTIELMKNFKSEDIKPIMTPNDFPNLTYNFADSKDVIPEFNGVLSNSLNDIYNATNKQIELIEKELVEFQNINKQLNKELENNKIELKKSHKFNWIMLGVTIFSSLIGLGSLIATIVIK